MGSVSTTDAQVTGGLEVQAGRATLVSNAGVTAYDHSAHVSLQRGGQVLVCATSAFHLLRSGAEDSLLFGLDRGAMEILASTRAQDVVLTPDLRFTVAGYGVLDLRLRVTPNGDTCVENRGSNAPVLQVAESFSGSTYKLLPGQHVLFEHGTVKEVVDNERSPCGCPAEPPAAIAALPGQPGSPQLAAAQHPFPVAQSQDLAPTAAPTTPPTGETGAAQTQVSASLAFSPDGTAKDSTTVPPPVVSAPATPPVVVATAPPPSPPGPKRVFRSIGRFFRKLFGSDDQSPAKP